MTSGTARLLADRRDGGRLCMAGATPVGTVQNPKREKRIYGSKTYSDVHETRL